MQQEVYVDLYFLINTSMNLLCLMITAALLHRTVRRWRAILAAAAGAVYAVLSLLFGGGGILGFLCDCGVALWMCVITFFQKGLSLPRLLKITAVQILTSMILGGIMTALYTCLNRLHLPLEQLQGDGLSVWTFAILTAAASIATIRGGRWFGFASKTRHVHIHARLFGKSITLRAMVDTGNLLRDPLSGRSVIVADRELLLPLLPVSLATALRKNDLQQWLSDYENAKHIRLIPTKSATGETLLPAFLPEELTVTEGKNSYPANYLIALGSLSQSAAGFDAIIPGT